MSKPGNRKGVPPWNKGLKGVQVSWSKGKKIEISSTARKNIISANKKRRGEKAYQFKGGRRINTHGYVIVCDPIRGGNKREHRKVMEEQLGRKLKSEEEVHHIDGNKQNNNIINLRLMKSKSEHIKFHFAQRRLKVK